MKRSLSDRFLRSLTQPQAAPREIWDQQLRGFGCRASAQGVVSFFAMRRTRGSSKSIRIKIGNFPVMSLSEARARARGLLQEMQDGVDPRERRAEEARREATKRAGTFTTVAETFITRHVASKRTADSIESIIRRELIPRWGDRPIGDIKRADIIAMVDEIVDRGHSEAARQAFTYARRLFSWAIGRGLLEHSPADHVPLKDLVGEKSFRRRVLTPAELALFWRATTGSEASYFGSYARLLLLLGVRRTELGRRLGMSSISIRRYGLFR